jgi:2-C-methyl-D-erythritol 2,4-cyclodiphosphate synthase
VIFLEEAVRLMQEKGFTVVNLDSIVHLEKPKIRAFVEEMRIFAAKRLAVKIECVSVKAKTGEGLGAIGKSRAIKAEACILLMQN